MAIVVLLIAGFCAGSVVTTIIFTILVKRSPADG